MTDDTLDMAHCYGRVLALISLARIELEFGARVAKAIELLKQAEAIDKDREGRADRERRAVK